MYKYSLFLLLFLPVVASAQTGSLQQLLVGIGGFLNSVVIPFILAIAFLVFFVNAIRFFVIGGSSDDGQKNAKNLAVYGIGAFVFILSFWGLVNILVDGVGLSGGPCYPVSDYINPSDGTSCPPPGGSVAVAPVAPPLPSPTPGALPILPSPTGDPSPVRPGPPTLPPVSFDPNGNPFGSTLAALQIAQRDIDTEATEYATTWLTDDFGHNATVLNATLFARPLTPEAAYRLNLFGILSDTAFDNFLTTLNAHNTAVNTAQSAITRASLAAIPPSIPPEILANQAVTANQIRAEITAYNQNNGFFETDIDADAEISRLFDLTVPPNERHDRVLELVGTVFSTNQSTNALYERIITDINTTSLYTATTPTAWIESEI